MKRSAKEYPINNRGRYALHVAVFFITLFLPRYTHAHDLWVTVEKDTMTLNYGHLTGHKDGDDLLEYDPRTVTAAFCINKGAALQSKVIITGRLAGVRGVCDAVIFQMDEGYFTKTPHGTVKKKRNQAQFPLKSWISHESVKSLLRQTDENMKPAGKGLEITPLDKWETIQVGEKLTFLVTENGTPLSEIPVSIEGNVRGITDRGGRINLRIRSDGHHIIQASKTISLNREDADEEIFTATLHFQTGIKQ